MLVNYLSDVLPKERRLAQPTCDQCGENFSTINYLVWPRVCTNCHRPRGSRTWIVEIVFAIAGAWLGHNAPPGLGFGLSTAVLAYFLLVIVIDVEHRLILHPVSLIGVGLGLVVGVHLHGWSETLTGGIAGFAIMFVLYLAGIVLVRFWVRWQETTRIDKNTKQDNVEGAGSLSNEEPIEALGFGDVTLCGVIGLMLGWPGIMLGIMLTIVLGGVGGLLALLTALARGRYNATLAIPYGPFLAGSALLLLLFSEQILSIIY